MYTCETIPWINIVCYATILVKGHSKFKNGVVKYLLVGDVLFVTNTVMLIEVLIE